MKRRKIFLSAAAICLLAVTTVSAAIMNSNSSEAKNDINEYASVPVSPAEVFVGTSEELDAFSNRSQNYGVENYSAADLSGYESVTATTKQVSENVYEVLDETGEVIAIYEPAEGAGTQPRLGWTIDWTVNAGVQTGANSRFSSYNGLNFTYDLDFSRTGTSKIGYANHDEQTVTWVETSADGFNGSFTFLKDVGSVSLALKNASSNTITYSGVYYVN